MNCTEGCTSESECRFTTTFIATSIFLAFIAFCGGQFCYIISLKKRLYEDSQPLLNETPPPYQASSSQQNI